MFAANPSRRAGARWLGLRATAIALLSLSSSRSLAQIVVAPQELTELKRARLAVDEVTLAVPTRVPTAAVYWGCAAVVVDGGGGGTNSPRSVVDLYVGLKPNQNGFWSWGESVYWALDDGRMGPDAVVVGGGHVTEYEFSFGLHADFPDDTIQPFVIVSFYNAPPDPVADADDPVVEPPLPVSSVGWLFEPITLPAAGEWAIRSELIDLVSWGIAFDLDDTYYVEVFPVEWGGSGWVFDPDVHAVFTGPSTVTLGENQDHMWSDAWVRDEYGGIVYGDGDGFYDHPDELDAGGHQPHLNRSGVILRGTECPEPTLALSINEPDNVCVRPGEPVTVTLSMSCLTEVVRGFQGFLAFDASALTFVSGSYTNVPFGLPIIDPIVAAAGDIDVASGIDDLNGQEPTSTSADLVTLIFVAGTGEGPTSVEFRSHEPPTRFSDVFGNEIVPLPVDSPTIVVDGTPPMISCPDDISVHADAGDCTASVDPGLATAVDTFDPDPTIEYKRSDRPEWNDGLLDPYPSGSTTITWRATDCAGNVSECMQTIEVSDQNELVVQIALAGTIDPGPFTRCITFELWECDGPSSVLAEDVLTFTNGTASATVLVPCGQYECIVARAKLHTLRSTLDGPLFQIVGTQYVADFAAAGKDLIGGDLNDDGLIDALDFGVFTFQWNTIVGADTDCATPYPHADIDGNGIVGTEDFTFIQINFMATDDDNCCDAPGPGQSRQPGIGTVTP